MKKKSQMSKASKPTPRVELIVTRDGWTWTVYADGQKQSFSMQRTTTGARGTQKGDIYEALNDDDLAEAIDDMNNELEICRALEFL